jgi:protein involved in polysaccharide export with SLBB domain
VRSFKVFVVGTVPDPGVRTASAATRVSEVVPATQGGVARRNIVLRRASGETLLLDLVPFLQNGDLRANPTLREGDALVVPVVDRIVQVLGRVAFPAAYEFREGESLADLLRMANGGGGFPASAADTLRMTRFTDAGERQVMVLSRAEAMGARGRALTVRPYDAVFVPEVSNFRQQKTATVFGQVRRPGVYPIQPDTTTVRELVEMAGGFTPQASLVAGTLRRTPELGLRRPLIELVSDSALTPDERQVRAIAQADSGQAFVVIDFEQLFLHGADAFNQRIQNGDQLVIPRLRHEVTVLGAVLRPGIVEYRQGASFEDYVQLAGGYSRRADRGGVALIRAGLGNQLQARDVWYPQPGDQVVVPFAPRRAALERLRSINAFVTAIATTLVSVVFLARL